MAASKKVVILGGSGIGMIAARIIDQTEGLELLGFLNDVIPAGTMIGKYRQVEVLGNSQDVHRYLEDDQVGVCIAYLGMTQEKTVWDKVMALDIPMDRFINLIDPTCAIPEGYCQLGRGVLMAPLAHLSPDATIGDNCILLPNAFVGHDTTLDRFVSIANNASIGANVHIERGAHIGSNATIREKLTIGEFSLIGMGSVVLKDVAPGSIVVGNPARVIRQGS